ncbi:MAG: OmpA family protein [Bacteroidota bacterium]
MSAIRFALTGALLGLLLGTSAHAQANQFRDSRSHFGIAIGQFTYHGPVDLLRRESSSNFVRERDPALVLLGSFPLVGDQLYFRAMVGFSNFNTDDGEDLVNRFGGQNEFLTESLLWFEPEVVWTPFPGSRSRLMPYVFTGFGSLIANPFDNTGRANRPGSGIPGPERSVFTFPLGAGLDFALTDMFSVFAEYSYRFNLNYVGRNELQGPNPHDTSLLMAGVRLGLRNPFRKRLDFDGVDPPLPDPMAIPDYRPPIPMVVPETSVARCVLVDLNTVTFAYNVTSIDRQADRLLDENVRALLANPMCCIEIIGYTDRADGDAARAMRISQDRARAVYDYYLSQGIPAERMTVRAEGVAMPECEKGGKDEDGPGCRRNRRVETIPFDCSDLFNN